MQPEGKEWRPVSPARRIVAIALLVIGMAVAIPCGIVASVSTKNALKIQASAATPARFQVRLNSGEWELYEQTGTASGGSVGFFHYSYTNGRPLDIDVTNIRVENDQGAILPLGTRYGAHSFDTYSTGSRIYTGVASFDAAAAGAYSIAVDSPAPDGVIVARPPLTALTSSLPLIVAAVLGGAGFMVGLILLILDVDRRRRAKYSPQSYRPSGIWAQQARPGAPPSPPGWGPQPGVRPSGLGCPGRSWWSDERGRVRGDAEPFH